MAAATAPSAQTHKPDPRSVVVDALLALCAQKPFGEITLPEIAAEAGVSLADLRDLFPSKGAILGAFVRRIDRLVLDSAPPADEADMQTRVLGLMMRRFEALAPYRTALRSLHAAFAHDVTGLFALNQQALNSWRYLLASIGIETEGALGFVKLQGAIVVFGRLFPTFLDDTGEDLLATRLKAERELARAEWLLRRAEGVDELLAPVRGFFNAWRETRARRSEPGDRP